MGKKGLRFRNLLKLTVEILYGTSGDIMDGINSWNGFDFVLYGKGICNQDTGKNLVI